MKRVISSLLLGSMLWLWAVEVHAQAILHEEGFVQREDLAFPITNPIGSQRTWYHQIVEPETDYLLLHFDEIVDNTTSDYTVVVKGRSATITYPKADFGAQTSFWTDPIYGTVVDLSVKPDTITGLSFTLREYAVQIDGTQVLSITRPDSLKPIMEYASNPEVSRVARAVAKLTFVKKNEDNQQKLHACTGFMISEDRMITNHHCISAQRHCDTARALFGYEMTPQGMQRGTPYRCLRFERRISDHGLDLSVIQLEGAPGARWGFLDLSAVPLALNQPLYIIEHPGGEPKQISRADCIVSTPQATGRGTSGTLTDFGHKCDTKGGSSGSPVFNLQHQVVGLHHYGFSKRQRRWARENRAVQMQNILAFISQNDEELGEAAEEGLEEGALEEGPLQATPRRKVFAVDIPEDGTEAMLDIPGLDPDPSAFDASFFVRVDSEELRSTNLPVLLPTFLMMSGDASFYGLADQYAASIPLKEAEVEVSGSRIGFVVPDETLEEQEIGDGLFVEIGEYGIELSFSAYGALYHISVTCDQPETDERCTEEEFIRTIANQMNLILGDRE